MSASTTQTLLRDDVLRLDKSGPTILASQNDTTSALRFPPTSLPGWSAVDLPRTGELFSFSRVEMPSLHFAAGYTVGYVRFTGVTGSSVLVFGQLRARDGYEFSIGESLEVIADTLWVDAEEREVVGYIFVPVGEESSIVEARS